MVITAKEISQRLAGRSESVARWLLPNGKLAGPEWCVGSLSGEEGKSLKVHLTGEKAGVWADFAGNAKGDLLDLIAEVKKIPLSEAIKEAKGWLGISDPISCVPRKSYAKPQPKNVKKDPPAESPVVSYLTKERKLSLDILRKFKISESNNGSEIAFPSFSPTGDLVNVKYIGVKRDERGKKFVRQEKGCAPSLFGWHAIPQDCREVVICEGQIDAMTWAQMGFSALSVPDGVASDEWIDFDWDNIQQFDSIYLAYDNDEPGQKAITKVATRLGLARCFAVRVGDWKDANEALQSGATQSDFNKAVTSAKPMTPDQIKRPIDFKDKILERFYPPNGERPGFAPSIFDCELRFLPGEVTIWTGISGHGKSSLLSQIILDAIFHNQRAAIASMEMAGEKTMHRMICQSEMSTHPSRAEIETVLNWFSGRLWIYDLLGNVAGKQLFELMEYSHARNGVDEFVIDSLMKVSIDSEDYNAQRVFMNDLCAFAASKNVHVHLVAHARKGKNEQDAPGKMDVKGSSDIINQADNLVSVLRNKQKESDKYFGKLKPETEDTIPDAIVSCNKQRDSGKEFMKSLRYFTQIYRFSRMGNDYQDLSITRRARIEQEAMASSQPTEQATEQSNEESIF